MNDEIPCVKDRFSLCNCARCCAARMPKTKRSRKDVLTEIRMMGYRNETGWRVVQLFSGVSFKAAQAAWFEGRENATRADREVAALLARSSLGTPEAMAARARVPRELVDETLRRVDAIEGKAR